MRGGSTRTARLHLRDRIVGFQIHAGGDAQHSPQGRLVDPGREQGSQRGDIAITVRSDHRAHGLAGQNVGTTQGNDLSAGDGGVIERIAAVGTGDGGNLTVVQLAIGIGIIENGGTGDITVDDIAGMQRRERRERGGRNRATLRHRRQEHTAKDPHHRQGNGRERAQSGRGTGGTRGGRFRRDPVRSRSGGCSRITDGYTAGSVGDLDALGKTGTVQQEVLRVERSIHPAVQQGKIRRARRQVRRRLIDQTHAIARQAKDRGDLGITHHAHGRRAVGAFKGRRRLRQHCIRIDQDRRSQRVVGRGQGHQSHQDRRGHVRGKRVTGQTQCFGSGTICGQGVTPSRKN